jgi:hypothetical protein
MSACAKCEIRITHAIWKVLRVWLYAIGLPQEVPDMNDGRDLKSRRESNC